MFSSLVVNAGFVVGFFNIYIGLLGEPLSIISFFSDVKQQMKHYDSLLLTFTNEDLNLI